MSEGTNFRYLVRCAGKEAMKNLSKSLHSLNVTPNQCEVLLVVAEHEPITLKKLGDLLICEQKSPSRLVQSLVEKDFVFKGKSKMDARCSVLYLTKKGKKLIPLLQEKEAEFDAEFIEFIYSNMDINQIILGLQKYLRETESEKKLKNRNFWKEP